VFRRISSPAQATPACVIRTVGKLRRRATTFVLESLNFVACRRRHLRSNICPESVFSFRCFSHMSRYRFPANLTVATVHQNVPNLSHLNFGTISMLRLSRASSRTAQISRGGHFKIRAEMHLQEITAVCFSVTTVKSPVNFPSHFTLPVSRITSKLIQQPTGV
jgi:hypothetical protein